MERDQNWDSKKIKESKLNWHWFSSDNTLEPIKDRVLEELENGSGIFLIQGLRLPPQADADAIKTYATSLARSLGTPVSQDPKGSLVVDIRSTQADLQSALHYQLKADGTNTRPYETTVAFGYHSDPCDVAGLLCIQPAFRGGESRLVSSLEIRKLVAQNHPELLKTLYEPFYYAKPPRPDKTVGYHSIPIFSEFNGKFKGHIVPELIRAAQMNPEIPRLSPLQEHALAAVEKLCSDPKNYLELLLQAGDLLLFNNHTVFHARTSYEEALGDENSFNKRHLLRLWISVPNSRELDPIHRSWFGSTSAGAIRGGYARKPLLHQ